MALDAMDSGLFLHRSPPHGPPHPRDIPPHPQTEAREATRPPGPGISSAHGKTADVRYRCADPTGRNALYGADRVAHLHLRRLRIRDTLLLLRRGPVRIPQGLPFYARTAGPRLP